MTEKKNAEEDCTVDCEKNISVGIIYAIKSRNVNKWLP